MSAVTELLRGEGLSPAALGQFERYAALLTDWNTRIDLTAVSGARELAERHFLDSLSLRGLADFSAARVIDVGTGAGFPGLPLKIAAPTMQLTLLDSLGKRVDFLKAVCADTGIEAECLHARAEEQALLSGYRGAYDYAVSRAVARLNVLAELCLPFVRVGGAFLAMKAHDSDAELREAAKAIQTLGAELERVADFEVAGVPRRVAILRKTKETPSGYPRRFSRIQKNPLI